MNSDPHAAVGNSPLFMGIDIGTQSTRAGLFTAAGQTVGLASAPLKTTYPRPTWAEQDPHTWWTVLQQVVRRCLTDSNVDPGRLAAIALDSTACTVLLVDATGEPLRPALMWMDQRAHEQAKRISATKDPTLRYTGRKVSPEFGLPKTLWLRENEPELYEGAAIVGECQDWLNWKLTDRWVASRNIATCKWNYVEEEGGWPNRLLQTLDAADIGQRWPGGGETPLYPGAIIGPLTQAAAEALNLSPGIPVAQGGVDAYVAAIGMNTLHPGQLGMILGTSTCHIAISDLGVFGTGCWGPYPEPLMPGMWILEGGQTTSGSIIRWVEKTAGNGRSLSDLDAEAAAVGPGAEGLLALDYWGGNRTPRQDPLARGVFVGLTLSHTTGHLLRAVYEAIAFGTRHILEDMVAQGFEPSEMVASGGGAQSQLWLQLNADICGLPVVLTDQPESTVLGAAMCATVGDGAYPDLQAAGAAMVRERERIKPNPDVKPFYDSLYRDYLETYEALRPVMHRLTSSESE